MTAQRRIDVGGIEVRLRHHPRARRLTLRVSNGADHATLTTPPGTSQRTITQFLDGHSDWLRRALSQTPTPVIVAPEATIPIEGTPYRIALSDRKRIQAADGVLHIPGPAAKVAPRVKAWLRLQAQDRLAERTQVHANGLGREITGLRLRDTRSRWGSCASDGRLMFSWRLILAPADVLDYVAAHEVAHLAHMHHGPAFWDAVKSLMPNYETPRLWLRRNGATLHRYQF